MIHSVTWNNPNQLLQKFKDERTLLKNKKVTINHVHICLFASFCFVISACFCKKTKHTQVMNGGN